MRMNKPGADLKPTMIVANDSEDLKGTLKRIGGSQSDNWNNTLANQAVQALWLQHSDKDKRDRQYSATVAALSGIKPKDEVEGMIAAQLIAQVRRIRLLRMTIDNSVRFEGTFGNRSL